MLRLLLIVAGAYLLWNFIRVLARLFSSGSGRYGRVHESTPRKPESSTGPAEISDADFEDLDSDNRKQGD